MVNFDTRVFTEQQGQVIGAEVTVYSDNGDRIGNIAITDAASITELQQRLAVIDETYFTEERLQAILANSQETNNINATSLNGFISSDFAKVSQLNNYAPVSHNHTKNQITDLYNYQITASKYNVDIDTDVTITVKVTNQLGQPVVGVSVPVLKNNQSWKTGTTGGNGSFSLTYTADTWGLVMFSANNSSVHMSVTGWKLIETKPLGSDSNGIKLYSNGERALVIFNAHNVTCIKGLTTLYIPPTTYAPIGGLLSVTNVSVVNEMVQFGNNGAKFEYYSPTGGSRRIAISIDYPI